MINNLGRTDVGLPTRRFLTRCLLSASAAANLRRLLGSPSANNQEDADERTAWYREAKFGMFIHWGPYSLASVEASWPIMRPSERFPISEAQYRALPKQFNPDKFDPYAWIELARSAGQRYMVFTTKHHDGFCMFDSAYTYYKITNTPFRNDIVAMLAKACARESMPLGFYYSPPDMNHPAYRNTRQLASTNWNGEPTREQWPVYLQYMQMQLRELLQNYGEVVLVWFDGLYHQEKYDGRHVVQALHEIQRQTLVNNRIGIPGDFETPEQFLPATIPVKGRMLDFDHYDAGSKPGEVPRAEDFRLWETCMTINTTWAYNKSDREFKSAQNLIRTLVEVASRGGNFLLNVGPEPNGIIQPEFQERLRAIGQWLAVNGEAIYGTTYGPMQSLPFARTTRKGRFVFLHVFEMPADSIRLPPTPGRVQKVTLLSGERPVTFRQSDREITISTSGISSDPNVTVFRLTME